MAVANVGALVYPISLFLRADKPESEFFAAILVLGVAFVMAIADTVGTIVAYL